MALAQIIYVSRPAQRMSADELTELVEASEKRNAKRDITGTLLYSAGNFMQLLEGELTDIGNVFERVRCDARHTEVRALLHKNVTKRLYPEWGMLQMDIGRSAPLNLGRMERMIYEVRQSRDTQQFGIEARMLLSDFRLQLA